LVKVPYRAIAVVHTGTLLGVVPTLATPRKEA